MLLHRFLAAAAIMALVAGPVVAQPTKTDPAPPKAAPKTEAPKKAAPVTAKVNLNTATAQELDKLPQIGPARAKAIIEARAKARFKNWGDFVARKVVPANAEKAIKDLVTF